jgi:hypothetical protein
MPNQSKIRGWRSTLVPFNGLKWTYLRSSHKKSEETRTVVGTTKKEDMFFILFHFNTLVFQNMERSAKMERTFHIASKAKDSY